MCLRTYDFQVIEDVGIAPNVLNDTLDRKPLWCA